MLTVGHDLTKMTPVELYAHRNACTVARSKTDIPEERNRYSREKARATRLLNALGLPANTDDYLAGLHLWTEHYDFITTVRARIASDRHLQKWQFVEAMKALTLLPGHSYRIYLRYIRLSGSSKRTFRDIVAFDLNSLSAPAGSWRKIGVLEL